MEVSIFRVSNCSLRLALVLTANIVISGCGGNSSSGNQTTNNPVPAISSLSPASLPAGSAAQTLTIHGSGFLASSSVSLNGTSRAATYVSSGQLTIALTSTDLSTAASDPVVVLNPAPGGGASTAVNFTVDNLAPAISSLSPASLLAGSGAQTLIINGSGFMASSSVSFNGTSSAATYVSSSQLTIGLTSADLSTAASDPVVVSNPAPGGGASTAVNFTVDNLAPTISSLSPASLPAGSAAQTLTIRGSGFLASSSVSFSGTSRVATYVSSSQLTIALTSADLSTAASDPVVVSNPAPGGGASTAVNFTVTPAIAIQGKAEGGEQPIVGAQVYLYAAGTTGADRGGYGANATSLLDAPGYVTTGSDGSFAASYDLSACQSAQDLVYIIAVGGDSGGAGSNPSTVLMSALSNCANLSSNTSVLVNEVTTVASVYALQQFMNTGAGNFDVGTSSTNVTGLKNAFLDVTNLVNGSTGTALATTPNGNGTVPQAEINTLANIIAECVNSPGDSSACSNLFANATPPGGTAPADTLHAVLDIAQNPGNNVGTLYEMSSSQAPFAPALTAAPSDWTLAIEYTGGGLERPSYVAVDAPGNVWVANTGGNSVDEFNTLGVSLQGRFGISNPNVPTSPTGIAVDPSGNIWVSNGANPYVAEFTSTGSYLLTVPWGCDSENLAIDASGDVYGPGSQGGPVCEYSAGGIASMVQWGPVAYAVAIDGSGNVWMPTEFSNIGEFSSSLNMVSGEPTTGWSDPSASDMLSAAIDAQGNVWSANGALLGGAAVVTELSPSGAVLSGSGYAIASNADTIAIDGNDTVWVANIDDALTHLANNGTAISPLTGYQVPGNIGGIFYQPEVGLAVDASGNIWTTGWNPTSTDGWNLVEWVGLAAPVATPLVQNLVNHPTTIGQRP